MKIVQIKENKKQYLKILLIGDEQESMIDKYLSASSLFVAFEEDKPVSVCAVLKIDDKTVEIKNLATVEDSRGNGYASDLIKFVCEKYKNSAGFLILGTGENPKTLNFYKTRGFKVTHRIKDFFIEHYDHPIFEDGVQLRDMIYLTRELC